MEKIGDVRLAAGDRAGALSAYEEDLAITRKLAGTDHGNTEGQTDLVLALELVSSASDPSRARAALHEAIAIVDVLARDGKLTATQRDWPRDLRDALAKLPPEQAKAR
jgi:hypothetical protein